MKFIPTKTTNSSKQRWKSPENDSVRSDTLNLLQIDRALSRVHSRAQNVNSSAGCSLIHVALSPAAPLDLFSMSAAADQPRCKRLASSPPPFPPPKARFVQSESRRRVVCYVFSNARDFWCVYVEFWAERNWFWNDGGARERSCCRGSRWCSITLILISTVRK